MIPGAGYLPVDSIFPLQGLDTLDPSVLCDPRYSPRMVNFITEKGLVKKRKGFSSLGRDTTVDGVPMALVNFQDASNTEHLVLVTTTKQYVYKSSDDSWTNITYQVTGSDHDWTGDESDIINWTVGVGTQGRWLIITNGKDEVLYWDGNLANKFKQLKDEVGFLLTDFATCTDICMFYGYLVMAGVKTASWNHTKISWSAYQSLIDFETQADGAGEIVVSDAFGDIQRIVPLGDRLVIYAANSIGVLTFVGGDAIFTEEQLVQDTRLVSPRSIVNVGPYHLFMRRENISLFDGTRLVRDVGDKIFPEYKDTLDADNHHRGFAFLDTPHNHVYFGVPDINTALSRLYIAEYDPAAPQSIRWSPHTFSKRLTCMGFYTRATALGWDDLDTTAWTSLGMTWNQMGGQKGFPQRVLGWSDGTVSLADDIQGTDESIAIAGSWESIDFVAQSGFQSVMCRWLEVELDLLGTSATISYSIDKGETWTTIETVTLSGAWERVKLDFDVVSRSIRFKVSTTGQAELRWLRVWMQEREAA